MKKWLWVTLVGLALIGFFLWVSRDPRVVRLADGTVLRIHTATYGIKSAPKPQFRPRWLDRVASRLPAKLHRLLPPPNPQLASGWTVGEENLPVVTIWFSHYDPIARRYLEDSGPAKLRPVKGDLTMFGSATTDRLTWGDDKFFLLSWTFKNNSFRFLFQTNLISFVDPGLELQILDLQDQVIGRVTLPNPAFGQKPPP